MVLAEDGGRELLLPEEQLEPGPEKAFKQLDGSQWAKSVSHQPYWEPGGRDSNQQRFGGSMLEGWVGGMSKVTVEWSTYSSFLQHILCCHTAGHNFEQLPRRRSQE